MRLFRKGQGATEYLLMLAAVLVIVAIAVYYIATAGAAKPAMTMSATITTDNKVQMLITSGALTAADYQWRILKPDGTVDTAWTDGTVDLAPKNSPVTLTTLTTPTTGNWKVQIYHKPSKSTYPDFPFTVS